MLLPAADLSIAVEGFALQDLFAKAVKGVLLVFGVAIRFHVLTSLRAGRQFFSSPFAHYSFCGRLFWPALPGKIKIIFSVAHLCVPFVLIGFPPVKQDLAFTVSTDVTAAELKQVIVDAAGSSLESIELFDVYTGDQLGEDEKSLAYAVTFRAPDKTLASEDSEAIRKRIVDEASKLGAQLRA